MNALHHLWKRWSNHSNTENPAISELSTAPATASSDIASSKGEVFSSSKGEEGVTFENVVFGSREESKRQATSKAAEKVLPAWSASPLCNRQPTPTCTPCVAKPRSADEKTKLRKRDFDTSQSTDVSSRIQLGMPATSQTLRSSEEEKSRPTSKARLVTAADAVVPAIKQVPASSADSGVVRSAADSGVVRSVYAAFRDLVGVHIGGYTWLATHMLLRRNAIQQERDSKVLLDSTWFEDPQGSHHVMCKYLIDMIGPATNCLCSKARKSLENECLVHYQMSIEQMSLTSAWIPNHLPQLCGPDAVFQTTIVLGVVSKYSNPAWDRLFRSKDEIQQFMQTEQAVGSPLCEVGLFPLIGLLDRRDERALANKYFKDCLTGFKGTRFEGSSKVAHYASLTEFVATCVDKRGKLIECGFWITCSLQNHGAVVVRTIRCIPLPKLDVP